MSADCLFCKIASKQIPSKMVWREDPDIFSRSRTSARRRLRTYCLCPRKHFVSLDERDAGRPARSSGGCNSWPRSWPASATLLDGLPVHGLQLNGGGRRSVRISSPPALARRSPIPLAARVEVELKACWRLGRLGRSGRPPRGNARTAIICSDNSTA